MWAFDQPLDTRLGSGKFLDIHKLNRYCSHRLQIKMQLEKFMLAGIEPLFN